MVSKILRCQPVLILMALFTCTGIALAGDDPTSCNACSPNSTALDQVTQALAKEGGEDPIHLSDKEKKQIKKAREDLISEKLLDQQLVAYDKQLREFWEFKREYRSIFGTEDESSERILRVLSSPDAVDAELKSGTHRKLNLNDPNTKAKIDHLKAAHTRIWFRDPELKEFIAKDFEEKDTDKAAEKLAKKHFEDPKRLEAMDRILTQAYLKQRAEYLKKNKQSEYTKEDLKNLDIDFRLDLHPTSTIPMNEHKNLGFKELQDLALEKTEGTDHESIFCQPFPNDPKFLTSNDPVLGTQTPGKPLQITPTEGTVKVEEIVHQETCNLSQTFGPDLTEIDSQSRGVIQECLSRAKNNPGCAGGISSLSASVQSCSDTRSSGKFASNLELSQARAAAMGKAFSEEALGLLKIKASATPDDAASRETYENSYTSADGKSILTGTCGPRPPKGYSTEPWMPSSRNFCAASPGPSAEKSKECLSLMPKNQLWKCDPGQIFKTKQDENEFYKGYRMSNLTISYTCKEPKVTKTPPDANAGGIMPSEGDPKTAFMKSIECGVFFKCFSPIVTINTFEPVRGKVGGGSGGDRDRGYPGFKPRGRGKSIPCPKW